MIKIRLLSVYKGEEGEQIRCALVSSGRVPLEDGRLSYEALSYCWGTGLATEEIKMVEPTRDDKFYVRPNLHAALKALRDPKQNIYLWVDAICINQENKMEKNTQVLKMAEIYNEADNVCIWLGESTETSHAAIAFIPEMLDLTAFDKLIRDQESADKWFALAESMRNSWFNRRWVVQELALARNATLICGSDSRHWSDFADAVALFVSNIDIIKDLFRFQRKYAQDSDPLGDFVLWAQTSL
jgi:hypothetical protein